MALPVNMKIGGAAAARIGQYKKRELCRNEKWAVSEAGALPQREMVSINGWIAVAAKNGQYNRQGAAATRNGQYEKRGRSRKEIRAVKN